MIFFYLIVNTFSHFFFILNSLFLSLFQWFLFNWLLRSLQLKVNCYFRTIIEKHIFLFELQSFLSETNVVWKSSEADDHDLSSLLYENDGELQFSFFLIIVYTLVISISYIRFDYLIFEIFMIQSCLEFWYYRIFLIHLKSIFAFEAGTKLTRMFQIWFFLEEKSSDE